MAAAFWITAQCRNRAVSYDNDSFLQYNVYLLFFLSNTKCLREASTPLIDKVVLELKVATVVTKKSTVFSM
jgi:hypothetical protein